jgi:AcrR family transcriptional regulator
VLAAAAKLFARKGYDAASLEDIAEAAGFSKGAVYSNFASKAELFVALVTENVEARLALVASAIGDDGDVAEAAGAAMAEALVRDPDWHCLFLEFCLAARRSPPVARLLRDHRRRIRRLVARAIRRHGGARRLGAERAAVIVLALSNGLAIERLIDPSSVSADVFTTALAALAKSDVS